MLYGVASIAVTHFNTLHIARASRIIWMLRIIWMSMALRIVCIDMGLHISIGWANCTLIDLLFRARFLGFLVRLASYVPRLGFALRWVFRF